MSHLLPQDQPQPESLQFHSQTEHLLSNFPVQLPPQLLPPPPTHHLKQQIHTKMQCLLRHMLSQSKSKKQCYGFIKNACFLNEGKFTNEGKGKGNSKKGMGKNIEIAKSVAKIKMLKSTIDKQVLEDMCYGIGVEILLGKHLGDISDL